MAGDHANVETGRLARPVSVRVWDPLVRIFHWSLAAAFLIAFFSEEGEMLHNNAGYVVIGLILFRLVWGFIGGPHARFGDFITSPAKAFRYVFDILRGHARRYIGHNPAGGAMVLALLTMCLVTAASGWAMTTEALWGNEWVEGLHGAAANITLGLVGLHVLGVLIACWQHRENLVKAMITGRKPAGVE